MEKSVETQITTDAISQEIKNPEIDTPKAPYTFALSIPNGTVQCAICGLPGGKLIIADSLGKRWTITANTNLMKRDGKLTHQNLQVCAIGKNTVGLPKYENL